MCNHTSFIIQVQPKTNTDLEEEEKNTAGLSQNSPWSLLPLLQFLLQGSLQQEEVKQRHCRYTQRANIINLVTL